ncbi:MAG TPA: glycosyltransferase family 87 protein [Candidatus Dormibacteraeota bacterium]|nr:glycosyltransferase family 87 protein [Candidatus Dormibacteraeota bacterium]
MAGDPPEGPSRVRRWATAMIVGLALAGALLVIRQPASSRATSDFVVPYSAGRLVLAGHANRVYDQAWLAPELVRTAAGVPIDPTLPFSEPLALLAPFTILALFPVEVALRIWQGVSVLLLFAGIVTLQALLPLGRRAPITGLILLLAAIPTWSMLLEGQQSALVLLGAAFAATALVGDQPWVALPGAALLALKPQYLAPFLVLLLLRRHPRTMAYALCGSLIVLLSTGLAGGLPAFAAMGHNMLATNSQTPLRLNETWSGLLADVVPAPAQIPAALTVVLGGLVCAAILGIKLRGERLALVAATTWLAVLASPHTLPHDLVLLAVPAWCATALYREGRLPSPLWGLIACDAAIMFDALDPPVRLGAIAMTAVLIAYAVAFMQRRRESVHRPAAAA